MHARTHRTAPAPHAHTNVVDLRCSEQLLHYNEANRRVAIQTHRAAQGVFTTLGTMMHYMDPRITVAWAKRHDVNSPRPLSSSY